MSENTKIEWCDDTHNFWRGCTKVSPGCAHCYAEALDRRFKGGHWGKGAPRVRSQSFNAPLVWNEKPMVENHTGKAVTRDGLHPGFNPQWYHRRRVFSLSMGDWLDEEVPIEWLADMLNVIYRCPNLDFLLLTKRPHAWQSRMEAVLETQFTGTPLTLWMANWLGTNDHAVIVPHNIWIGASVENQAAADERIPALLAIPARVRFLSVEPMLGPVDFRAVGNRTPQLNALNGGWSVPRNTGKRMDGHRGIDWTIIGGESGPGARPCNIEWIRAGVRQCQAAGVPAFVKQLGARPMEMLCKGVHSVARPCGGRETEHDNPLQAVALLALKHPKGGDLAEWPEDLRVREFPQL